MCLLAFVALLFPRLAFGILWLARPAAIDATFDTVIWPLLGIIFLPFTTLLYVLLWTAGPGIEGFDWVWLAGAVFLDLGHYGVTAYSNRDKIPGMSSGGDAGTGEGGSAAA
jgi:hypothetical protein